MIMIWFQNSREVSRIAKTEEGRTWLHFAKSELQILKVGF